MTKKIFLVVVTFIVLIATTLIYKKNNTHLPIIAIANYGPHSSLSAAIKGFKEQMSKDGFIEGKTISYKESDVGFDQSLISQMLSALNSKKPKLMLAMTTPVAQMAKSKIKDTPIVFTVITDPVSAGLLKNPHSAGANITGSSEKQDLELFLKFSFTLQCYMFH